MQAEEGYTTVGNQSRPPSTPEEKQQVEDYLRELELRTRRMEQKGRQDAVLRGETFDGLK